MNCVYSIFTKEHPSLIKLKEHWKKFLQKNEKDSHFYNDFKKIQSIIDKDEPYDIPRPSFSNPSIYNPIDEKWTQLMDFFFGIHTDYLYELEKLKIENNK